MTAPTTGLAVRYRLDATSDYVIEPVTDEAAQAQLVRHLILNQGRAAEPVTLIPQPDAPALAKIRRNITEDIVAQYAAGEIDEHQAFNLLALLAPGLHGRDEDEAEELFTLTAGLLRDTADEHRNWTALRTGSLSDFEPEMRDPDLLDKRHRALVDQELDALMSHLDAHTAPRNIAKAAA